MRSIGLARSDHIHCSAAACGSGALVTSTRESDQSGDGPMICTGPSAPFTKETRESLGLIDDLAQRGLKQSRVDEAGDLQIFGKVVCRIRRIDGLGEPNAKLGVRQEERIILLWLAASLLFWSRGRRPPNTSFCVPFAEAPYAVEYEPIFGTNRVYRGCTIGSSSENGRRHGRMRIVPCRRSASAESNRKSAAARALGLRRTVSAVRRAARARSSINGGDRRFILWRFLFRNERPSRGCGLPDVGSSPEKRIVLILMDSSLWHWREGGDR